ncbi:MAG: hypothetical protein J2P21_12820, partial [Chloracidobacterium sp.]|nr:hypothetical protein [Chloracidobacterium sp.]
FLSLRFISLEMLSDSIANKIRWNQIKTTLMIAGVIAVLLMALLAYTFAPAKLDVAANQNPTPPTTRGRPDPSQLPEVTLSILKAGKMPARQAFAYRGGTSVVVAETG